MEFNKAVGRSLGFACLWLAASSAQAVSPRAYVSVNGSDANTCNVPTTPCRTFVGAIAQTTSGGEVIVLDSGTFGGGTITQSVTINAPGGVAALAATPLTVTVGASDVVTLRGISFVAPSPGIGTALTFNGAGTLNIENCVFHGWATGLLVNVPGEIHVTDTTFRENSTAGVYLSAASGSLLASFERTSLLGNGAGMVASDRSKIAIKNSLISGNSTSGLIVLSTDPAGLAELDVERCLITHNLYGAASNGGSGGYGTLRISTSTITGNTDIGLGEFNTSVVLSRGDNTIEANTNNTSGSIGSFVKK